MKVGVDIYLVIDKYNDCMAIVRLKYYKVNDKIYRA